MESTTRFNQTVERYSGPTLSGLTTSMGTCFLHLIGVNTAMHETVGHGFLGGYLMRHYTPDALPHFQVDGWDNWRAIFQSQSVTKGMRNTWRWLTAYDANSDGAMGKAWVRGGRPNAFATWMGPDALSAWTSLSGSIPDLTLSSAASIGGIHLLERSPKIAAALLGFALINHLLTSCYPLHAALMTAKKLSEKAATGHDFAKFALKVGKITGYTPTTVAKLTALVWMASVPALCAYTALTKYSHPIYCVSDERAEAELKRKGKQGPYSAYELDQARTRLYRAWRTQRGSSRIYRVLKIFTLGRLTISLAAKWGEILTASAFPSFAIYAKGLKLLVPIMGVAAIGAKGARCYVDFKADDVVVTKRAKWISVLDLAITIGVAAGLFRGLYSHQSRTYIASLVASSLKPIVIRQARLREERIAFEAA